MTLLYFPVCVILAWVADRRMLFYKYMHKRYRADKRHGIVVEMEGDLAPKGIDVIMDGKLSDAAACPGTPSSVTVSVQTGGEDEVRPIYASPARPCLPYARPPFMHVLAAQGATCSLPTEGGSKKHFNC